jgi:aspartate/methionine/tyrosine aminotransferase
VLIADSVSRPLVHRGVRGAGADAQATDPMMARNLTSYEIDSLPQCYNLTDGHAFRRWTATEQAIIDRSAQLFMNNDRRRQAEIEHAYVRDFLRLAGQTFDGDALGFLMCFTASMAFEIVANYLRVNRLRLALIEPCFDNLADIFRRHAIPLQPLPDQLLDGSPETFARGLRDIDADAICLVTPNNPTGVPLAESNLRLLLDFCQEHRKLLILDNCFRAYLPRRLIHDEYRLLLETGVDAVMVEDTGKTWPTSEIKAPFFAASRAGGLFDRIYDIYTDFLLHVSPVAIKLMHEFIRLSQKDGMASIHGVVAVNRKALYDNLEGTFLTPCERPFASVAWLRIDHPVSGLELKRTLDERGVFVLPGNQFYWHDRRRGENFIRVALVRDADMFREATARMAEACREVAHTARV